MPKALIITLVNQRSEIPRLAEVIEQFAREHQLSDEDLNDINLVLDEVVMNVISYAFDDDAEHKIEVRLTLDADRVTMVVSDDGKPFDPESAPAPMLDAPIEDRKVGGLGLFIIKALGCEIDYQRKDDRNVLTVAKPLRTA